MRFKKLIAAGASFLLVVGASTLGAAAAYADDAPVTDPVVTETTTEPVVEPDPAPAPEPVVEPVPEPAPEPEPVTEPVVEPTTDPVESDPPSTESDSDPPVGTSNDFTSSSSDSGDVPTTFSRTTSSLKSGFAEGNHTTEPLLCTDLTAGESGWTSKVDTVGDPATVNYTAPTGYLIDKYCVKAGTEPVIVPVDPPAASIVIDHPTKDSVSHWQVHLIAVTVVTPAAQGSDETCLRDTVLVGGTIQLTLITGVTYTITGPGGNVTFDGTGLASGLAAGDYDVSFVLASGYTTSVVSPIEITIGEYDGECGEVDDIVVTPAAQGSDETCDLEEQTEIVIIVGGTIQLTLITGVTYTITGPGAVNVPFNGSGLATGLAAGDYDVSFVLASGYTTSVLSPIEITIGGAEGGCDEVDDIVVNPAAQATDQTCVFLIPVEGSVQVTPIAGVTYTITGPNGVVPVDGSGSTGPVPPGQYSVAFVLASGYTTSVVSPILVTVNAFEGECELVDFPLVIPAVTSTALSCLDLGSYTLSNDLDDPLAVEWTVNGNPLGSPLSSPTQFSVTSPGVYNIHAEPNDPDYGFPDGTQDDWTLTFVDEEDCDLTTLALTGQSPGALIGGAMVLVLTGLALFRMRTARRERMTLI